MLKDDGIQNPFFKVHWSLEGKELIHTMPLDVDSFHLVKGKKRYLKLINTIVLFITLRMKVSQEIKFPLIYLILKEVS